MKVSFGEMIRAISDDLREGQTERIADGLPPLFKVNSLELEVNFVIEKSEDAKGGVKFWVIEAGAGVGSKHSTTHKAKLQLEVAELTPQEKVKNMLQWFNAQDETEYHMPVTPVPYIPPELFESPGTLANRSDTYEMSQSFSKLFANVPEEKK